MFFNFEDENNSTIHSENFSAYHMQIICIKQLFLVNIQVSVASQIAATE